MIDVSSFLNQAGEFKELLYRLLLFRWEYLSGSYTAWRDKYQQVAGTAWPSDISAQLIAFKPVVSKMGTNQYITWTSGATEYDPGTPSLSSSVFTDLNAKQRAFLENLMLNIWTSTSSQSTTESGIQIVDFPALWDTAMKGVIENFDSMNAIWYWIYTNKVLAGIIGGAIVVIPTSLFGLYRIRKSEEY